MEQTLSIDKTSNIQKIRDMLLELSKIEVFPHKDDMEFSKGLIKEYFLDKNSILNDGR